MHSLLVSPLYHGFLPTVDTRSIHKLALVQWFDRTRQSSSEWLGYIHCKRAWNSVGVFLISFRILYAAALTSSKPTKMGSSNSPATGFYKSANLFTNSEPTRTNVKVTRTPFSLYQSWCCFELYYDTVLGTILFLWWIYRGCVGNWVKIFPPKQSHSAVRQNNDPIAQTTSK